MTSEKELQMMKKELQLLAEELYQWVEKIDYGKMDKLLSRPMDNNQLVITVYDALMAMAGAMMDRREELITEEEKK